MLGKTLYPSGTHHPLNKTLGAIETQLNRSPKVSLPTAIIAKSIYFLPAPTN